MQELESLLAKRETAIEIDFDHLQHRVRCYAHIINICASHIISSMTSVSEQYLSGLKVPVGTVHMTSADDDDDDDYDDDDIDSSEDITELQLEGQYDAHGDSGLERWFADIKRDPLKRARRVIRLLRSSDTRKTAFREHIRAGNERGWFTVNVEKSKSVKVTVPEVHLLRDVKTRWDLVYLMLQRLRALRPVSSSQRPDSTVGTK
jgi:hypothetical protein